MELDKGIKLVRNPGVKSGSASDFNINPLGIQLKYDPNKYDLGFAEGMNQEWVRGYNQSTGKKFWNGLKRSTLSVGTKTISQAGYSLGFLAGMDSDDIYNNMISTWANKLEQDIKEDSPIYKSKQYETGNLWNKIWTPEFYADTVFDGLAYAASSLLTSKGVGALSKLTKANKLHAFFKGKKGFDVAIGNALKNGDTVVTAGLNTLGEAFTEGEDVYRSLIEQGVDKEKALKAANNTTGYNMLFLLPSNLYQASLFKGKAVKEFKALKDSYKAGERIKFDSKELIKEIGKSWVSEGLWEENIQNAVSTFEKEYAKAVDKSEVNSIADNYIDGIQAFGKFLNPRKNIKVGSKEDDLATNIIVGGIVGKTQALVSTTQQYFRDKKQFKYFENLFNVMKNKSTIASSMYQENLGEVFEYEDTIETETDDKGNEKEVSKRKIKLDENGDPTLNQRKLSKLPLSKISSDVIYNMATDAVLEGNDTALEHIKNLSDAVLAYRIATNEAVGWTDQEFLDDYVEEILLKTDDKYKKQGIDLELTDRKKQVLDLHSKITDILSKTESLVKESDPYYEEIKYIVNRTLVHELATMNSLEKLSPTLDMGEGVSSQESFNKLLNDSRKFLSSVKDMVVDIYSKIDEASTSDGNLMVNLDGFLAERDYAQLGFDYHKSKDGVKAMASNSSSLSEYSEKKYSPMILGRKLSNVLDEINGKGLASIEQEGTDQLREYIGKLFTSKDIILDKLYGTKEVLSSELAEKKSRQEEIYKKLYEVDGKEQEALNSELESLSKSIDNINHLLNPVDDLIMQETLNLKNGEVKTLDIDFTEWFAFNKFAVGAEAIYEKLKSLKDGDPIPFSDRKLINLISKLEVLKEYKDTIDEEAFKNINDMIETLTKAAEQAANEKYNRGAKNLKHANGITNLQTKMFKFFGIDMEQSSFGEAMANLNLLINKIQTFTEEEREEFLDKFNKEFYDTFKEDGKQVSKIGISSNNVSYPYSFMNRLEGIITSNWPNIAVEDTPFKDFFRTKKISDLLPLLEDPNIPESVKEKIEQNLNKRQAFFFRSLLDSSIPKDLVKITVEELFKDKDVTPSLEQITFVLESIIYLQSEFNIPVYKGVFKNKKRTLVETKNGITMSTFGEGVAGAGKTTMMRIILNTMKRLNPKLQVLVVADTDAALENIKKAVGEDNSMLVKDLVEADTSKYDLVIMDEAAAYPSVDNQTTGEPGLQTAVDTLRKKNSKVKIMTTGDTNQPKARRSTPYVIATNKVVSPLTINYRAGVSFMESSSAQYMGNRKKVDNPAYTATQSIEEVYESSFPVFGVLGNTTGKSASESIIELIQSGFKGKSVILVATQEQKADYASISDQVEVFTYKEFNGREVDNVFIDIPINGRDYLGRPFRGNIDPFTKEEDLSSYNEAMYTAINRAKKFAFVGSVTDASNMKSPLDSSSEQEVRNVTLEQLKTQGEEFLEDFNKKLIQKGNKGVNITIKSRVAETIEVPEDVEPKTDAEKKIVEKIKEENEIIEENQNEISEDDWEVEGVTSMNKKNKEEVGGVIFEDPNVEEVGITEEVEVVKKDGVQYHDLFFLNKKSIKDLYPGQTLHVVRLTEKKNGTTYTSIGLVQKVKEDDLGQPTDTAYKITTILSNEELEENQAFADYINNLQKSKKIPVSSPTNKNDLITINDINNFSLGEVKVEKANTLRVEYSDKNNPEFKRGLIASIMRYFYRTYFKGNSTKFAPKDKEFIPVGDDAEFIKNLGNRIRIIKFNKFIESPSSPYFKYTKAGGGWGLRKGKTYLEIKSPSTKRGVKIEQDHIFIGMQDAPMTSKSKDFKRLKEFYSAAKEVIDILGLHKLKLQDPTLYILMEQLKKNYSIDSNGELVKSQDLPIDELYTKEVINSITEEKLNEVKEPLDRLFKSFYGPKNVPIKMTEKEFENSEEKQMGYEFKKLNENDDKGFLFRTKMENDEKVIDTKKVMHKIPSAGEGPAQVAWHKIAAANYTIDVKDKNGKIEEVPIRLPELKDNKGRSRRMYGARLIQKNNVNYKKLHGAAKRLLMDLKGDNSIALNVRSPFEFNEKKLDEYLTEYFENDLSLVQEAKQKLEELSKNLQKSHVKLEVLESMLDNISQNKSPNETGMRYIKEPFHIGTINHKGKNVADNLDWIEENIGTTMGKIVPSQVTVSFPEQPSEQTTKKITTEEFNKDSSFFKQTEDEVTIEEVAPEIQEEITKKNKLNKESTVEDEKEPQESTKPKKKPAAVKKADSKLTNNLNTLLINAHPDLEIKWTEKIDTENNKDLIQIKSRLSNKLISNLIDKGAIIKNCK